MCECATRNPSFLDLRKVGVHSHLPANSRSVPVVAIKPKPKPPSSPLAPSVCVVICSRAEDSTREVPRTHQTRRVLFLNQNYGERSLKKFSDR